MSSKPDVVNIAVTRLSQGLYDHQRMAEMAIAMMTGVGALRAGFPAFLLGGKRTSSSSIDEELRDHSNSSSSAMLS